MSEFYNVRERKSSRKKRICAECRRVINPGDPYRACSGKTEGEFWTMVVHPECQIWASAVIYDGGDGRGLLADEDPAYDWDPEELAERIRENPPSEALRQRLPARWLRAVDAALAKATAPPSEGGEK